MEKWHDYFAEGKSVKTHSRGEGRRSRGVCLTLSLVTFFFSIDLKVFKNS